jgi:hypothetical protein
LRRCLHDREGSLAHPLFEDLFAQLDGYRCDLDQLVVAEVLQGVLQGHLAHGRERQSVFGTRGADVDELLVDKLD